MKFFKSAHFLLKRWAGITFDWIHFIASHPSRFRFLPRWWERRVFDMSFRQPIPWMTFESIEWIKHHLKKTDVGFEWGTGGSTFFFANRVARLTSTEHDATWHRTILDALTKQKIEAVTYQLVEPSSISTTDVIDPLYLSSDEVYDQVHFRAYCSAIDSFADASLDFVIVDGRSRNGCIAHAIPKLKSGGMLILDNSEREAYASGKHLLANWTCQAFYGPGPYNRGFWQTSIYIRP